MRLAAYACSKNRITAEAPGENAIPEKPLLHAARYVSKADRYPASKEIGAAIARFGERRAGCEMFVAPCEGQPRRNRPDELEPGHITDLG